MKKVSQLRTTNYELRTVRGFTLIETLVAISLLTVAIVAPMSLTAQSLASAYYARDQVTAFYLAQEAIEALRAVRDSQILQIAKSANASSINIFGPIPQNDTPFTIDAHLVSSCTTNSCPAITNCSGGTCPQLQTDGVLYGYESGWTPTNFTRTVKVHSVSGNPDEIRVTVTVTWQEGTIVQPRSFSISENLYRWINDSSSVAS